MCQPRVPALQASGDPAGSPSHLEEGAQASLQVWPCAILEKGSESYTQH